MKHIFNRINPSIFSLFLIFILLINCSEKHESASIEMDPIQYVDPFIGTGFHGHTFPGPVRPNGMVQPGPDTRLNGWDASSGYHFSDTTIYGFSQTHLSGTGIGDMGDILLLPFTGDVNEKPIANFSKTQEKAEVGYYSVKFDNYDVKSELAATNRVGMHRYTFSGNERKQVLVDIGHILQRTWSHENVYNELEFIDNKSLKGLKHSSGWAFDHKVFYHIEFSSPFEVDKTVVDSLQVGLTKVYKGQNIHSYLSFNELNQGEPLLVKVSVSSVDTEGAKKNMMEELPGWDFDKVTKDSQKEWRSLLTKIKVNSKDEEKLRIFYTSLYHSLIAPMMAQDVDGRYRGMDLEVHQGSEEQPNYTVYSLWDTFRALHPLMTILDEKKSVDWVNNLILKYKEGGLLPMWPLASNYTATMVGYPAVANIADALSKNLPGIDKNEALEAALTSASYDPSLVEGTKNPRHKNVMPLYNKFVNENRHIPSDKIIKSVSFGLEMAYYDWCISQIATMSKKDSIARVFQSRAKNYALYFDKETGFMRGKNEDGSWVTPFNPKYSSHERSDYVEGNAWQWTWFVPHDIKGFKDLYGSDENFTQKLDSLFTTSSEIIGEDASGDITGLIGQYAHGNEPSHHIAYLYTYAGQAWKTQELVDQILNEFYSDQPEGIIGNEDCGQMSAWYVLNAMGFYQVTPGNPIYTIGRPLFDQVSIELDSGKTFSVVTENNSAENKYVQAFYIDEVKQEDLFFHHKTITEGGTLRIVMGPSPKMN